MQRITTVTFSEQVGDILVEVEREVEETPGVFMFNDNLTIRFHGSAYTDDRTRATSYSYGPRRVPEVRGLSKEDLEKLIKFLQDVAEEV